MTALASLWLRFTSSAHAPFRGGFELGLGEGGGGAESASDHSADLPSLLLQCMHPLPSGFTKEKPLWPPLQRRLCSSASTGHSDGEANGQEQINDVETDRDSPGKGHTAEGILDPECQGERILIQCSNRLTKGPKHACVCIMRTQDVTRQPDASVCPSSERDQGEVSEPGRPLCCLPWLWQPCLAGGWLMSGAFHLENKQPAAGPLVQPETNEADPKSAGNSLEAPGPVPHLRIFLGEHVT